jgi:arylsulfatase A-like enzyme
MTPYVYLENGVPTRPPTETVDASPYPAFYRGGPIADDFKHEDVMPRITEKAVGFIDRCCADHADQPFFLYFPLTAPHTPWMPLERNKQKSKAGIYGDFVTLVDWTVGQILQILDERGLTDNTLVILTSDNGSHEAHIGEHNNGVSTGSPNFGHEANYIYRGQKSDVWDGGHRVPFLARWPAVVTPGSRCDQPICLTDLLATCAEIADENLPANAGEDSVSFLAYLQGRQPAEPLREAVVHHSIRGVFAIRKGKWKFIDGVGSGGWSGKGDGLPGQLYNMETDPIEQDNLYDETEHEPVVRRLKNLLERYKRDGRTRPLH